MLIFVFGILSPYSLINEHDVKIRLYRHPRMQHTSPLFLFFLSSFSSSPSFPSFTFVNSWIVSSFSSSHFLFHLIHFLSLCTSHKLLFHPSLLSSISLLSTFQFCFFFLSPSLHFLTCDIYTCINIFVSLSFPPTLFLPPYHLSLSLSLIPLPVFLSPPTIPCNYLLRIKPERIWSDGRLVSPPFAVLLSSSVFQLIVFPPPRLCVLVPLQTSYTCDLVYISLMSAVTYDLVSCISAVFMFLSFFHNVTSSL